MVSQRIMDKIHGRQILYKRAGTWGFKIVEDDVLPDFCKENCIVVYAFSITKLCDRSSHLTWDCLDSVFVEEETYEVENYEDSKPVVSQWLLGLHNGS